MGFKQEELEENTQLWISKELQIFHHWLVSESLKHMLLRNCIQDWFNCIKSRKESTMQLELAITIATLFSLRMLANNS